MLGRYIRNGELFTDNASGALPYAGPVSNRPEERGIDLDFFDKLHANP